MLDKGFTGLSRTLDVLDQLGLTHTGSARTQQEAQQYTIVDIQGIRFGFLAYTYPISVKRTPSEMKNAALNLFDLEKVKADIAAIRASGAEVVLVSLHWGPQENNPEPSDEFRQVVKSLLKAGADGILGHHPHVLQPMEWIEIEREGETVRCPVLYSQGNFHCNPANEGNAESCISYLTFEMCIRDRLIIVRHAQDTGHLAADGILVGDMAFNPAALIAQRHNSQQHILNSRSIVLHCKASSTIGGNPLRKHTDHGRSRFPDGRLDHRPQLFQRIRVIHRDQAGRLLVASRRRCKARPQDGQQVIPRHRFRLIPPPVACPKLNRFQRIHFIFLPALS